MAVPKRKKSKSKTASRKARNLKKPAAKASFCSHCGSPKLSHRACPHCGYYGDRQVLSIVADE